MVTYQNMSMNTYMNMSI